MAHHTEEIKEWRSVVTLIVFVLTNLVVLFPFNIPIYVPRILYNGAWSLLSSCRIISRRPRRSSTRSEDGNTTAFVRFNFHMSFSTAPLIADLFLLAISAIGRQEVHDGTVGADHISPIDIMVFFLTLAYIAISIDASGLIRYLAFKVLQKGGKVGHLLFFYLYAFFFILGTFIGNDPIILSGTAFLAYMTRVSSNITHPKAWIYAQFAVANISSAILVSSNPTNLVLAGAFKIKFIVYTANMIVPVVVTAIVLFPFLLYVVFANTDLIPLSILMHEISEEEKNKKPVNPNIPQAKGKKNDQDTEKSGESNQLLLGEIMNPFLDKGGATAGGIVMAAALITLLAINAASQKSGEHPVFWVTLPAAFVMFCWDVAFGWKHRKETREIAVKRQEEFRSMQAERMAREEEESSREKIALDNASARPSPHIGEIVPPTPAMSISEDKAACSSVSSTAMELPASSMKNDRSSKEKTIYQPEITQALPHSSFENLDPGLNEPSDEESPRSSDQSPHNSFSQDENGPTTLASLISKAYRWLQETFPTVVAVVAHLPFKLVPFALSMFVLIQGLVTKGWVPVFAEGWDHWVNRTGTIGAIGGMGFLSVILSNFAGTNIGTAILLCRIVQAWEQLRTESGVPISDRTFWATVYSIALGTNYGAFSTAFSASLAGLLWRDILSRKHIRVKRLEFARENLPIIATAMAVGCTVLVGEVYIMRGQEPYRLG